MKSQFWKLIIGLVVCFALPWFILLVLPYLGEAKAKPVAYSEADEVELTEYPDRGTLRYGSSSVGAKVYAAEGCAYCHTQMIRPSYAGQADMWRENWGGRDAEGLNRETRPEDYTGEPFAFLGYQRLGQDLSNVGHRITTREDMHRLLTDPKSFESDSGMPAYRHLYKKGPNGELVPTFKADALVDYLLSRKKDAKIPAADTRNR